LYASLTKSRYLCSKIFNGKFVLGKYITPLKGKIGMMSGNFFINILYKKKQLHGSGIL